MTVSRTIIPATPGWFVALFLGAIGKDETDDIMLEPIVAPVVWRFATPKPEPSAASGDRLRRRRRALGQTDHDRKRTIWRMGNPETRRQTLHPRRCHL